MFNPGIRSSNSTRWVERGESPGSPVGPELDYDSLAKSLKEGSYDPEVQNALELGQLSPNIVDMKTIDKEEQPPSAMSEPDSKPSVTSPTSSPSPAQHGPLNAPHAPTPSSSNGPSDGDTENDGSDELEATYIVRDRRTFGAYSIDDLNEEKTNNSELDEKSIIPVPGMMISYEEDDSTTAPIVSDWIAPQGPQWSHYTDT